MNTEMLNEIALDRLAGDFEGELRPEGRSHTRRAEPASQECERWGQVMRSPVPLGPSTNKLSIIFAQR